MNPIDQHLETLFGLSPGNERVQAVRARSVLMQVAQGGRLFASGDVCENFVLVVSGQARVQISTRTGRDITLFRLSPGQSCALTTSCLLSETPYYAEGIAETDIEFIAFPSSVFHEMLGSSPQLMRRLLGDYAARIANLTALVDRLTSRDLDAELANLLVSERDETGRVALSHQAIADDLRTAREVISRKLKALEQAGIVRLGRGELTVHDASLLNAAQQSRPAR